MTELKPTIMDLFNMMGKVALVTGGCRGLGFDEASTLADLGAQVVVTSRYLQNAMTAAELISSHAKVDAVGMALDVTDEKSVTEVFKVISKRFKRLDVLVNNAGGAPNAVHTSIFDRRLKDWNHVITTNLTGCFLCTRAASRIMKEQCSGSIINISSVAAIVGRDQRIYKGIDMRPNFPDYAASKAGIVGLTRESAAALGPFGIRVNAILPGGFKHGKLTRKFVHRYSSKTPLGRMGSMGYDIKGAIALLASDAGAYISGACIVVDGGFSIFK